MASWSMMRSCIANQRAILDSCFDLVERILDPCSQEDTYSSQLVSKRMRIDWRTLMDDLMLVDTRVVDTNWESMDWEVPPMDLDILGCWP